MGNDSSIATVMTSGIGGKYGILTNALGMSNGGMLGIKGATMGQQEEKRQPIKQQEVPKATYAPNAPKTKTNNLLQQHQTDLRRRLLLQNSTGIHKDDALKIK